MRETKELNKIANESADLKRRDSNLELYRIIIMVLIVAHHYVANSGIRGLMAESPTTFNSVFLGLISGWGKIGINCFVFISGYYMCKSNITLKKFAKILLEVVFYKYVFFGIFLFAGYEKLTLARLVDLLLPWTHIDKGFTECYLLFYLLIPFLNITIRNMTEKQHLALLLLCFLGYSVMDSLPGCSVTMNYTTWFIILYFFAAYVRMYPRPTFENKKVWKWAAIISVSISAISIIVLTWVGKLINNDLRYSMVSDSNKPLALITGFCLFMSFKNMKLRYNKVINALGGATFGVLLIHANSDAMRKWLWQDFLKVPEMFESGFLVVHVIGSVIGIFVVCALIDLLRIRYLETPFFLFWDKHWDSFLIRYKHIEQKIVNFLQIKE